MSSGNTKSKSSKSSNDRNSKSSYNTLSEPKTLGLNLSKIKKSCILTDINDLVDNPLYGNFPLYNLDYFFTVIKKMTKGTSGDSVFVVSLTDFGKKYIFEKRDSSITNDDLEQCVF